MESQAETSLYYYDSSDPLRDLHDGTDANISRSNPVGSLKTIQDNADILSNDELPGKRAAGYFVGLHNSLFAPSYEVALHGKRKILFDASPDWQIAGCGLPIEPNEVRIFDTDDYTPQLEAIPSAQDFEAFTDLDEHLPENQLSDPRYDIGLRSLTSHGSTSSSATGDFSIPDAELTIPSIQPDDHTGATTLDPDSTEATAKQFTCTVCIKSFERSSDLKKHEQRTHRPHDQRPYQCGLCEKRFLHPKDLRRHMTTHHKPAFQCEDCRKYFTRPDNLARHRSKCPVRRSLRYNAASPPVHLDPPDQAKIHLGALSNPTHSDSSRLSSATPWAKRLWTAATLLSFASGGVGVNRSNTESEPELEPVADDTIGRNAGAYSFQSVASQDGDVDMEACAERTATSVAETRRTESSNVASTRSATRPQSPANNLDSPVTLGSYKERPDTDEHTSLTLEQTYGVETQASPSKSLAARLRELADEYDAYLEQEETDTSDNDDSLSECSGISLEKRSLPAGNSQSLDVRHALIVHTPTNECSGANTSASGGAFSLAGASSQGPSGSQFTGEDGGNGGPDGGDDSSGGDHRGRGGSPVAREVSGGMIRCVILTCDGLSPSIAPWLRAIANAHDICICNRCWQRIEKKDFKDHVKERQCENNCVCENGPKSPKRQRNTTLHPHVSGTCGTNIKMLKECQYEYVCHLVDAEVRGFIDGVETNHDGQISRKRRSLKKTQADALREAAERIDQLQAENQMLRTRVDELNSINQTVIEQLNNTDRTFQARVDGFNNTIEELRNIIEQFVERFSHTGQSIDRSIAKRIRKHAPGILPCSATDQSGPSIPPSAPPPFLAPGPELNSRFIPPSAPAPLSNTVDGPSNHASLQVPMASFSSPAAGPSSHPVPLLSTAPPHEPLADQSSSPNPPPASTSFSSDMEFGQDEDDNVDFDGFLNSNPEQ